MYYQFKKPVTKTALFRCFCISVIWLHILSSLTSEKSKQWLDHHVLRKSISSTTNTSHNSTKICLEIGDSIAERKFKFYNKYLKLRYKTRRVLTNLCTGWRSSPRLYVSWTFCFFLFLGVSRFVHSWLEEKKKIRIR